MIMVCGSFSPNFMQSVRCPGAKIKLLFPVDLYSAACQLDLEWQFLINFPFAFTCHFPASAISVPGTQHSFMCTNSLLHTPAAPSAPFAYFLNKVWVGHIQSYSIAASQLAIKDVNQKCGKSAFRLQRLGKHGGKNQQKNPNRKRTIFILSRLDTKLHLRN